MNWEIGIDTCTLLILWIKQNGLPRWPSGKESSCQCRRLKRCEFNLWVGKICWGRELLPTPVFLPGEFHGLRRKWQPPPVFLPGESQG